MSYAAKVDVILSGMRELSLLEDRLEKINSVISVLNKTPVALNVGGRGPARDLSGQLSKDVNDYVRAWVNGEKEIGKSINAVSQQQAAFNELLQETAMVNRDTSSSGKNAVNNLADAWAETTKALEEYRERLEGIQTQALQKAGLPIGPVSQLGTVEADSARARAVQEVAEQTKRTQLEQGRLNMQIIRQGIEEDKIFVSKMKQEMLTRRAAITEERINKILKERQRAQQQEQDVMLGAGFPLLFGGGPGSVAGGLLGALAGGGEGGFGLQILGSALGQIFDDLVVKAAAIGNALQNATANMDALREAGISVTAELEAQVRALNRAGEAAKAQALINEEIAAQTGDVGGLGARGAAMMVNELQKAWNGVVSAVSTLVGILASPFIAVLTAALRLVQLIARSLNTIVTGIGALINLIPGVKELGDKLYELSVQGTEEYEKRQVALDKETEALERAVQLQGNYNKGLERASSLRGNEFRLAKQLLDYQKRAAEANEAINNKREELGAGSTSAERERIGKLLFAFQFKEFKKLKEFRLGIERDVMTAQEEHVKKINEMNEANARAYRDMRIAIERQIEDERIKAARAIEDIEIKRAKAVLDFRQRELNILQEQRKGELEINASLRELQASLSSDPGREGLAAQLTTAVEQYKNGIAEASEKRAIAEEQIRIDTLEASIRLERFKQDNARRVARVNEDSARKIADINTRIAKQQVESSKASYDYALRQLIARKESDIQDIESGIAQRESFLTVPTIPESSVIQVTAEINAFRAEVEVLKQSLSSLKNLQKNLPKTPTLKGMGALPKLTDLSSEVASQEKALNQYIERTRTALAVQETDLQVQKEAKKLASTNLALVKQRADAQSNILNSTTDEVAKAENYLFLLRSGINPEIAKQMATIQTANDNVAIAIDRSIESLEALNDPTFQDMIDKLKALKTELPEAVSAQADQINLLNALKAETEQREKIQGYMQKMKTDLTDIAGMTVSLAQSIETALGTAFYDLGVLLGESLAGVVEKTKTAEQAFADMFNSIAKSFLNMAAQIIAKQLVMYALQNVLGMFGGQSVKQLNLAGIQKYSGFANGGEPPVGKPSIVGERGPELFVPKTAGTIIPNHRLGGAGVTVGSINITVENSGESLSPAAQKQIAGQVQGLVLSTLANERRSGGML